MKSDGLVRYYLVMVCVLAVCSLISGCGNPTSAGDQALAANIAEITGTVKFKGKPTHSVEVHLINIDDETASSMAVTDGQGKFSMPGLPPGTYQVRLARQGGANGEPDPRLTSYWAESPLQAEVSPEKTDFEFDIDI